MKVRPVLRKPSEINEIRMIRVDENAMRELLFEVLMENSSEWFQLQGDSDKVIFHMDWDKANNYLSYFAVPIDRLSAVHSSKFQKKLRKSAITTATLFAKNRYRKLKICTSKSNSK